MLLLKIILLVASASVVKCYPRSCFLCFTLSILRANIVDRLQLAVSESSYVENTTASQKQSPSTVLLK